MEILFAGLIALGVAVAVVFFLKFLCFMGEFLNAQRKQLRRSRTSLFDYSQETGQTGRSNSILPTASGSNTDQNRQLGAFRRFSERLYIFCNEPVDPKSNQNAHLKHHESTEPDAESPPSYEEAMRLISQGSTTCESSSDVLTE